MEWYLKLGFSVLLLPGMKCGGCVSHVKKILEAQAGVSSASVNLATETALVRVLVPKVQQGKGGAGAQGAAQQAVAAKAATAERLAQVRELLLLMFKEDGPSAWTECMLQSFMGKLLTMLQTWDLRRRVGHVF